MAPGWTRVSISLLWVRLGVQFLCGVEPATPRAACNSGLCNVCCCCGDLVLIYSDKLAAATGDLVSQHQYNQKPGSGGAPRILHVLSRWIR